MGRPIHGPWRCDQGGDPERQKQKTRRGGRVCGAVCCSRTSLNLPDLYPLILMAAMGCYCHTPKNPRTPRRYPGKNPYISGPATCAAGARPTCRTTKSKVGQLQAAPLLPLTYSLPKERDLYTRGRARAHASARCARPCLHIRARVAVAGSGTTPATARPSADSPHKSGRVR